MNDLNHPILFQIYPELKEQTPFIRLGKFPTPVQRLKQIGKGNLWIKRDDLDSDLYSGNKVRKLEFILADVLRKKKTRIITLGGVGTNHGLAVGMHGKALGLECKLLTFRQPLTAFVKKNMLLFSRTISKIEYKESVWGTVFSYYLTERIKNPGAYFLFAGGSSPLGTVGFVNAAFELRQQIKAGEMPEPEVIFCPLGSNGTMAGLSLGCILAGLKTKVIGVRVTFSHLGPFPSCTEKTVLTLMRGTYRYLKKRGPSLPAIDRWETPYLISEYVGEGYGHPTEACCKTLVRVRELENILLDPTYTAKTFAAFLDYAEKISSSGKPLLYWHTFNSVDLSQEINSIDYRNIHACLKPLFNEEEMPV